MTFLQIVVLAIIQGLTEFLPVSSSAHLILASRLFSWPDQGLELDVAVHLGTLIAVLVYFRQDLMQLAGAWLRPVTTPAQGNNRYLGLAIVLGSIPVVVVGWLASSYVAVLLRDVRVIASATLFFGVILWVADKVCAREKDLTQMNLASGFMIGLAQILALIPGASRSGITITMGRMLKFNEEAAARFSFLLSVPVIAAAGSLGIYRIYSGQAVIQWQEFATAVVVAAAAGWLCIAAFLALLRKVGLVPFVWYRLFLGFLLLYLVN